MFFFITHRKVRGLRRGFETHQHLMTHPGEPCLAALGSAGGGPRTGVSTMRVPRAPVQQVALQLLLLMSASSARKRGGKQKHHHEPPAAADPPLPADGDAMKNLEERHAIAGLPRCQHRNWTVSIGMVSAKLRTVRAGLTTQHTPSPGARSRAVSAGLCGQTSG